MCNITLVSTTHKANGKCNSDELLKIIEKICPEVIFLEALESNYTDYDHLLFSQFGVNNNRLEINAIQKYGQNHTPECVPVLDTGLSDEFYIKCRIVLEVSRGREKKSEYTEYQQLLDNYNLLEKKYGFQFLNSEKSIELQEEMR
jgi:hypothetical protein